MHAQLLIDGITDERARWAEHEACFLPLPVALQQWRVRGRVAYNGGAATDNRKVSWWVWRMGAPKSVIGWWSINLPALEAEQRRWRVRPGTEKA